MVTPRSVHYSRSNSGTIAGGRILFGGDALGQGLAAGELAHGVPLAGGAQALGVGTGSLTHGVPLAAAAAALAAAVAALTVTASPMAGAATGGALAAGTLNVVSGSAQDITTFTLTSPAGGSNLPFMVGHAFAKGDVPSGTPLGADSDVQVTVKRLWNDGSVKHAIITGRKTLTAGVASTITLQTNGSVTGGASLTSADIQTAAPSASIQCGAIGTVNLSSLLASPFRTWVSGPEMVECHYRSAVGSDPNLNAWFHVRLFAGGRVWVRAIVENGYLDNGSGALASNSSKSYVPTVVIGGTTVYDNSGASLSNYENTRWSVEGWIGGNPAITPRHNDEYLRASKLVPNYAWTAPSEGTLNGVDLTYTPMAAGGIPTAMSSGGAGNHIGLLPLWDALYCATGDPRAYRAVMGNSSAINSRGIVWRSRNDNAIPTPGAFTTWTLDGPGGGGWKELTRGGLQWEYHHDPNESYLAYLISGDYWHYESMAMQAAMKFLCISSARGSGTSRIFLHDEIRGIAWALRTVGCYVAAAPDDDTTAANFRTWLQTGGYAHWKTKGPDNPTGNALGYPVALSTYDPALPLSQSPWMMHFWIASNGLVWDAEPGFADSSAHLAVRDWMYKGVVGIMGGNGVDSYCYTGASNYNITISPTVKPNFAYTEPAEFYSTWGQVWTATQGSANTSCGLTLGGGSAGAPSAAATGYWGNMMPALAYAVEHGATNASTAFSRLISASNWATVESSGFDNYPIWGVMPRGWVAGMPSWYPSVGAVVEITSGTTIGSSVRAAGGNSYPGTDPDDIVEPWSGGAIVYISGQPYLVAYGGGHGDSSYNGIHKFGPLFGPGSNSPTWSVFLAASALGTQNNNATYSDGRQCSPHSYNMLVGVDDKMYCLATNDNDSTSSGDAFSFTPSGQSVLANNPTTGQYGAAAHYAGKLYYIGANTSFDRLRIFNIAAGTWSSESNADIAFGNYVRMAVDTTRGKLLAIGSNAHAPTGDGAYWDLTSLSRQVQIDGPPNDTASLEYDADRDVFVSYQSGSLTVYETSAADLAAGSGASWVTRTFTGSAPASSPTQGTFGRFRHVPELRGYIVVPNLETSVYFFRSV